MTIMYQKPYAFLTLLLSLWYLPVSTVLSAGQELITDGGREVLLNEDGSWSFRSNARYATTKDGRRVRLKEDGRWEFVEHAAVTPVAAGMDSNLDIKLQKVVVEKYEKKVQKNVRVRSQTVFYIELGLSSHAKDSITMSENDISSIDVKDNNGRSYTVITLQPSPSILRAGESKTVQVRVEGAPKWLDKVKSVELTLKPGMTGITKPVALSEDVKFFDTRKVQGFEYK